MASTIEMIDKKTGYLHPKDVINSEITKVIAGLYHYVQMLDENRIKEIDLIQNFRSNLCEIRNFLDRHYRFEEEND